MKNKLWPIFWGIFFIIIGIGYGGDALNIWHFTVFFTGWWTFFIIIPSLISLIQKGYSTSDLVALLVGIILLLSRRDIINLSIIGKLLFPAILIFIGLSIIFKDVFKDRKYFKKNITYKGDPTEQYAIFSGNKQRISGNFLGARVNAIFGGYTLDLRNAVVDQDIIINATAIFGGIDIFIPEGVIVRTSTVPIFGGVTNRVSDPKEVNPPVILVNSVCMFGGINIK